MVDVNSRPIREVNYESETQRLHVTFRESGKTYTHCGVPEWLYREFLEAESMGRFYVHRLKHQYQC